MNAMKYETLYNGERIPRLGLGTWRMGGGMSPNRSEDERVISVLRAAVELGISRRTLHRKLHDYLAQPAAEAFEEDHL